MLHVSAASMTKRLELRGAQEGKARFSEFRWEMLCEAELAELCLRYLHIHLTLVGVLMETMDRALDDSSTRWSSRFYDCDNAWRSHAHAWTPLIEQATRDYYAAFEELK